MTSRIRSFSGLLLMLGILPVFAGLLACMPVPVGNPERSRIDPALTGVWVMNSEGEDAELYHLQPWDKRTWVMTGVLFEAGKHLDGEDLDINTAADAFTALENNEIGEKGITSTASVVYKVWINKMRGESIMTWELVGGFREDGSLAPEFWYVFKVIKLNETSFELHMVSPEHASFDHIPTRKEYDGDDYVRDTKRHWERALKKALDDPELYGEPLVFTRVPDDLLGKTSSLFQEVISFE